VYFTPTIPNDLSKIEFQRDVDGKIIKFISNEPTGTYTFTPHTVEKPKITVDELMTKTVEALGGEENLRKINSRVTKFDLDFVHQGLKGYGKVYEKAPNMSATDTTITALGKKIATIEEFFDGTGGGEKSSFSRNETYTGQRLEDVRFGADFYKLLDWKKDVKSAEVTGIQKVGDEEAYIVKVQPEKASPITYYISTKTFLPVKITSLIVSSTSPQKIPYSQTLSDYRNVDGVMIPFKTVSENPGMGEIVTYVKEVKHNGKIEDKKFKP
jgi:hypothetical protein